MIPNNNNKKKKTMMMLLSITTKTTLPASYVGKKYWAESASAKGLVDTKDGIFFATDVIQ